MKKTIRYSHLHASLVIVLSTSMGVFAGCSKTTQAPSSSFVRSYIGEHYAAFQSDSVRVYLAKSPGYPKDNLELISLLSSGALTGEMFYAAYERGSKDSITGNLPVSARSTIPLSCCQGEIDSELHSFGGPSVFIWTYSGDELGDV